MVKVLNQNDVNLVSILNQFFSSNFLRVRDFYSKEQQDKFVSKYSPDYFRAILEERKDLYGKRVLGSLQEGKAELNGLLIEVPVKVSFENGQDYFGNYLNWIFSTRSGVGSDLVDFSLNLFEQRNLEDLYLFGVQVENSRALEFFRSGFNERNFLELGLYPNDTMVRFGYSKSLNLKNVNLSSIKLRK